MGGGLSTVNANVTARRCNFTGNIARLDGGGLRVSYLSRASLDACRVAFNDGEILVLYSHSILVSIGIRIRVRVSIPNV